MADISIDDLKNQECQENITFNVEEEIIDMENETAQEYKKRLNKKLSEMTPDEKKRYNALSQKKKRSKEKEEQVEEINTEEIEKQKTLYNSLYVLKQKFPENTENIHIDPEMSYETLNQKKDLIMKIITDKHSHNLVFNTLLLGCRSVERGLNYFEVECLDGLADTTEDMKDDIVPILKEMVDLGEIDTSMLTPQLRLGILMSTAIVKTIEKNNDKKKNKNVVDALDTQ